jgi:Domain of unknown function (DUF4440)
MISRFWIAPAAAVTMASAASADCTGTGRHEAAALRYICESERAWSQAVASGDTNAAKRILADDYIGIGSSGKLFIKANMAAQAAKTALAVASSDNDYVHVRFFGNTALNQGGDTIRSKNGHVTHLLWTDTWLRRNGMWQVVQSQDIEQ